MWRNLVSEVVEVKCEQIGEQFAILRLPDPAATRQLMESLRRYGQTVPLIGWRAPDERLELLDGFKRLAALRQLERPRVRIQVLALTQQAARVAVLTLNRSTKSVSELEEGFVVRALVREDGLAQTEVAQLLGHDKSWVCRRLALVERLHDELQAQLRLGLLDPTRARELARLPRGNQEEVLTSVRSAELSAHQTARLIALFLPATRPQQLWMLAHPTEALSNATTPVKASRDIRLGEAATRLLFSLERFGQGARALLSALLQVPLSERSETERALLTNKLLLARTDAAQVGFGIERTLSAQEETDGVLRPGSTTTSRAPVPETGRLVESPAGPALPDQPQHGAQPDRASRAGT
jgi:ParB-like chromosome segregation protein Spo0J